MRNRKRYFASVRPSSLVRRPVPSAFSLSRSRHNQDRDLERDVHADERRLRARTPLTRIEFFLVLFVFAVVIEDIVVHFILLTLESIVFARMPAFAFLVVGILLRPVLNHGG